MSVKLNVKGKSQYSDDIAPNYRNSACGPVTAHIVVNYLNIAPLNRFTVDELYKQLGGTKIGLFKWRLIVNLRALLGKQWSVKSCTVTDALAQLDAGRPVLLRFDSYFNGRFLLRQKPLFKYHWVPLIGYEWRDEKLFLIIHDNGSRQRESRERIFDYAQQKPFLSFVKITPQK